MNLKTHFKIFLLFIFCSSLHAQNMRLFQLNVDAAGTCQNWNMAENIHSGQLFYCRSGTWAMITSGGGGGAANPGGSPGQIQTNVGGTAFGGISTTGTGLVVLSNAPTFLAPILGTPQSATLTNATGLPLASGISGFGTNVAAWLGTSNAGNIYITTGIIKGNGAGGYSSATGGTDYEFPLTFNSPLTRSGNIISCSGCMGGGGGTPGGSPGDIQTNVGGVSFGGVASSGTGSVARVISPVFVTPNLGTPSVAILTSATGLPLSTGITGFGSNVGAWLATSSAGGIYITTGIVKGNGSGGFSAAVAGVDYNQTTVTTSSNPSSITPDCISNNYVVVTGQAQTLTINNPTTCTQGQLITLQIKDAGVAETLTFGTNYRGINTVVPSATVAGKKMLISGRWDATDTKFNVLGVGVDGADLNFVLTDVANTFSGVQTFAGTKQTEVTVSDGATITFNLSTGNINRVVLGGNRTLALSNHGTGSFFTITLCQDSMGSRTVTWFTTIKWAGGSTPTLTTTANKCDKFTFDEYTSGTFEGTIAGQNF